MKRDATRPSPSTSAASPTLQRQEQGTKAAACTSCLVFLGLIASTIGCTDSPDVLAPTSDADLSALGEAPWVTPGLNPNRLPPIASFSVTCNSLLQCTFDASQSSASRGISSYEWLLDGEPLGTSIVEHETFNTATTIEATLTVTDNSGRQDHITNTVVVSAAADQPPTGHFSTTCNADLNCTFDASASADDQAIASYEWIVNGTVRATGAVVSRHFNASRTFRLRLRVTDSAGQTHVWTRDVLPASARHYVAVGDGGTILVNDGAGWTRKPSGTGADLLDVFGVDESNWWAVGAGVVLRTTDGGASWTDVTPPSLGNAVFAGVWADAGSVWVAGPAGLVLESTDGGASWSDHSLPQSLSTVPYGSSALPVDLLSVWVTPDKMFVTGNRDGLIASSTDGGETWSREYPSNSLRAEDPPFGPGLQYFDIWASGSMRAFAVGAGSELASYDGGTWVTAAPPALSYYNSVWGADTNTVWAFGGQGQIVYTNDGGASWSKQFNTNSNGLGALWGLSPTDVKLVTVEGGIWQYNGAFWVRETSGTTSDLNGVWGVDLNRRPRQPLPAPLAPEPNLVAGPITVSPASPVPIDQLLIQASVENASPVASGMFTYEIRLDGQALKSDQLSLAGQERFGVSWLGGAPPVGTHTVEVILDSQDQVAESDEADNAASSSLQVVTNAVVDLFVTQLTIQPSSPTGSDQIRIGGKVANAGPNAVAPPINWEFRLDGQVVATGQWPFGPLHPTATLSIGTPPLGPLTPGNHTAELVVDPGGLIAETDEANNRAVLGFTVN